LESSRCSCSLCSSQGAGRCANAQNAQGLDEVMCTLRRRTQKEAAWRPLLQNGIVMTAEPQLGLPTLETTHRGASAVTNRIASDRRGSLRFGYSN